MKGRLLYIVGPSGSGKDSLIDYARERAPSHVAFARRTITREAIAGGERHRAVTPEEFETLRAAGEFAMHWHANGFNYGIGREIVDWLKEGRTVVVSGSRGHLSEALAAFPGIEVVSVTAPPEALRKRLTSRGRESTDAIDARIARGTALKLAEGLAAFEIRNDRDLAYAGNELLLLLA